MYKLVFFSSVNFSFRYKFLHQWLILLRNKKFCGWISNFCFSGMGSLVYEYLLFVANDVIFFSDDVKTTTIAVAIASSLCCSIVWAIFHIIGVTRPSKTELKTKSNILSVYDEKHTIQRFYTRKQPVSSSVYKIMLFVISSSLVSLVGLWSLCELIRHISNFYLHC